MTLFLQYVLNGVAGGFVIGLLALSIVTVYRSTRVLSFAQGAIASFATYGYYQLTTVWRAPALVALPVALALAAAVGAASHVLVMRPLRRTDALTRTVSTLGIVLVLQVVMRVVWTGGETFVAPLASGRVGIGSVTIGAQELLIGVIALAAAVALGMWTSRSYRGLGLTSIAQDPDAARVLGVDPDRAGMLAWAVGGVLAALAGILVTPTLVLNPLQMTLIMVTALGAALVARFTSLPLALAGGCAIGIVQSLTTGYVNVSGLSETFGFIAVFVILLMSRARAGSALRSGGASW